VKTLAAIVLSYSIFVGGASFSKNVIVNPAQPLNLKAGRVVTLKETMRIQDTGEGFYFREVWDIKVAPDRTLFIKDVEDQVLQFDPRGKFIRSLMKKGSGPGELNEISEIFLTKDHVYLQGLPPKILGFDWQGNLIGETSLLRLDSLKLRLLSVGPEGYTLLKIGRPDLSKGVGWKESPREIIGISTDGHSVKAVGNFPIAVFVQQGSEGISWSTFRDLRAVPLNENTLVVSQTFEYELKTIDLQTGVVLRRFKRPYIRRPLNYPGGTANLDLPKYWPDIFAIHAVEGRIWVQTSTIDAKKGILFDIFEPDGRYVDYFYLNPLEKDMDPDQTG
jgi:hypothetical protein